MSLEKQDIKLLSPLGMAYIGDGIYEILVRERIITEKNMPVNKLHKKTVSYVCAKAQSQAFCVIESHLSDIELDIYKRGRNANGNHIPRSSNPIEYRRATGFEALFGYLYLNKDMKRINFLFNLIWDV